jgi:NodT family efflux transporter outer membrane factor (OMF) lipoprotein
MFERIRRLAVALVPLVLSACAASFPGHATDVSLPGQWRHNPRDAAEPVELHEWWKTFHDAQLDQLIARVSDSNLSVREAMARLAAARALERASAAEFAPSVEIAVEPADSPDARSSYLHAGPNATWMLGLFGRAPATVAAASADTGIASTDADMIRSGVVAETARTYFEWRMARATDRNLDARLAAQSERVELMRSRARLRLAAQLEVDAEENRLIELRSQRLAVARVATEATERLGALLASTDVPALEAASDDLPSWSTFRVENIPADVLRSRADVQRAEQAVLKAAAQLRLAQADLYPRLSLVGSLTVAVPIAGAAGAQSRSLAALAPVIDIPLFDWGRRRAIAEAQDHTLEAALLAYRESIVAGAHQVETALSALDSLGHDAEQRRSEVDRAVKTEQTFTTAVRLGRSSRLELLAIELNRLEADASALESEHARAVAYIELCQALGGASPPAPHAAESAPRLLRDPAT